MTKDLTYDEIKAMEKHRDMQGLLAALNDASNSNKPSIIHALGNIGDKRAIPAILDIIKNCEVRDPYNHIYASGCALGRIGDAGTIRMIIGWLSSKDDSLKIKGIKALQYGYNPDAILPIARLIKDPNISVRESATHSFCNLFFYTTDQRAIPYLVEALDDPGKKVRENAASALNQLYQKEDMEFIIGLLPRLMKVSGSQAVTLLLQMIKYRGIGVALPYLTSNDVELKANVAFAMGRSGNKDAVPALINLLADKEPRVIRSVARSLEELSANEAAIPLCEVLDNIRKNNEIGKYVQFIDAAFRALGSFKDTRTVDCIAGFIHENNQSIKIGAIVALGNIGSRSANTYLIEVLRERNPYDSKDRWIIQNIIKAFKQTKDERLLSELSSVIRYYCHTTSEKEIENCILDDDEDPEIYWKGDIRLVLMDIMLNNRENITAESIELLTKLSMFPVQLIREKAVYTLGQIPSFPL